MIRRRSAARQIVLICWAVAGLFGTGVAADQVPTPPAAPPSGAPEVDECVHREAIAASIAKLDSSRAAHTPFEELLRQMADIEKRILQLKPDAGRTCEEDFSIVGLSERFDPIRQELIRERRLQEIGRKPWPEHVKRAVMENRAELGMTREQVTAALGEPRNVDVTPTTRQEQWTYAGSDVSLFHRRRAVDDRANSSTFRLVLHLGVSRNHREGLVMMMSRRTFTTILAASLAATLNPRVARAGSRLAARNVVLVHGLFADGSSWSEVIPRLQAAGLNVTSVQNPLTTLDDAVAETQRVLSRQDGPTVLAGHSFSGMIVTEAGVDPKVTAVVYVAARAPDAGEDYSALASTFPPPPASAGIVFDGDEGRLTEAAFLRDFAGDLPETRARVLLCGPAAVSQGATRPARPRTPLGVRNRASMRSRREDRTINPDLQRFMAKRMGATTIEVKASHLSLISHPQEIANLIVQAAAQA